MEFLRSREFRIFLAATLAAALLALVITIVVVAAGGRRPSAELPEVPAAAPEPRQRVDPESVLLPESWSMPRLSEPVYYRAPGQQWTYGRIEPFWIPPESVRYETVKKKSDDAVRAFLEPLP